ncbi:hypothetical protein [Jeotgalibacillus alimentarius]|nr:hypothetical protein [Jeotgalibacillus alimentarius]
MIFIICGAVMWAALAFLGPAGFILIGAALAAMIVHGYLLISTMHSEFERKSISPEQRFKEATEKYKVK